MDRQSVPEAIRSLYSCAWIRGKRITRMEEQTVAALELDAATAWELGTNNVGVFGGGCRSFDDILRRLRGLESPSVRPCWVVIPSTKNAASAIISDWFLRDETKSVPPDVPRVPIQHQNIVLAPPEQLRHIDRSLTDEIAGVILIDEACIVYRARGDTNGKFFRNDRPQHVANFRNQLIQDGWLPPFLVLTTKPAKSVNTHSVARAFCLDAFWFIAGNSLACGPVSIRKIVPFDVE